MSSVDVSTQVAELQAKVDSLLQTQAANTGGTAPHFGIKAGMPPHTVLGPCDADGHVLPGSWNTTTGEWEDPETAKTNAAAVAADQEAAVQAAKEQVQAANKAKALEIAKKELADEADLATQVAEAKAELSGSANVQPDASLPGSFNIATGLEGADFGGRGATGSSNVAPSGSQAPPAPPF